MFSRLVDSSLVHVRFEGAVFQLLHSESLHSLVEPLLIQFVPQLCHQLERLRFGWLTNKLTIQSEYLRLSKLQFKILASLQLLQLQVTLQALNFYLFLRLGNSLIYWRVERAIFDLLVLFVTSSLGYFCLLLFKLSLKLLRELLLVFRRIDWVYFDVCIYSWLERAIFQHHLLVLVSVNCLLAERLVGFVNYWCFGSNYWTNCVYLWLESPLVLLFLLLCRQDLLSPCLVLRVESVYSFFWCLYITTRIWCANQLTGQTDLGFKGAILLLGLKP